MNSYSRNILFSIVIKTRTLYLGFSTCSGGELCGWISDHVDDLWSGIVSLPPATITDELSSSLTVWIWVRLSVYYVGSMWLLCGIDDQGVNYEITQDGATRCSQGELLVCWWFNDGDCNIAVGVVCKEWQCWCSSCRWVQADSAGRRWCPEQSVPCQCQGVCLCATVLQAYGVVRKLLHRTH